MARLDNKAVRGVILEKGGQTAHVTILARARNIPLLIHVPEATRKIQNGDPAPGGRSGRKGFH